MKAKRVIIIHGWADVPNRGWQGWLGRELSKQGVEVIAPAMPRPKLPVLADWHATIADVVGELDEETVLIGHSLGTFSLLRFLENYQGKGKAGQLILVAGFLENGGRSLKPYFAPVPDLTRVSERVENIYHIFSDKDHLVTPDKSQKLAHLLKGKTYQLPGYGHFMTNKIVEFPLVLDIITDY